MALVSPLIPQLYNTTEPIRALASKMLLITAAVMPINSLANACYFTMRSGGKTFITFLFDSVYMWAIIVPTVFLLANFTAISIEWLYVAGTLAEVVKCAFGYAFLRKVNWARQLVSHSEETVAAQ